MIYYTLFFESLFRLKKIKNYTCSRKFDFFFQYCTDKVCEKILYITNVWTDDYIKTEYPRNGTTTCP